jgi:hypothetical protein
LHRLEEIGHLLLGLLSSLLVLLLLQLLSSLALLIGCSSRGGGGVDLLDGLLGRSSLFVLHTKGLVDGDLLDLGLLALPFWRHDGWMRFS